MHTVQPMNYVSAHKHPHAHAHAHSHTHTKQELLFSVSFLTYFMRLSPSLSSFCSVIHFVLNLKSTSLF